MDQSKACTFAVNHYNYFLNFQIIVKFTDQIKLYCFWSANYVFEPKKAQILNLVIFYSYLMFCTVSSQVSGSIIMNFLVIYRLEICNK